MKLIEAIQAIRKGRLAAKGATAARNPDPDLPM
jgi:hypothetical protein